MGKAPVDIIKYIIHAEAEASGLVEKPDLIGAIFGQTEGLLGEDLDLRELQKSGRIGRIDADIETKGGVTKAKVTVPSSLDMVETSIIAAGIETITRVGPCDSKFKIKEIEDIREAKREIVVNRAREILKDLLSKEIPDAKEIAEEVRQDVRGGEVTTVQGLDAGPAVETSESIILVEGRADVLNLLRNGIKNAIAIGGIKITKEAVDLCNSRTSTVFVDGDRGGDLIIKSLENAGAQIDFLAHAPKGREVENLSRKEIIMALRRKVAAGKALAEMGVEKKQDSKPPPRGGYPPRDSRRPEGRSRPSDRGSRQRSRPPRTDSRTPRSLGRSVPVPTSKEGELLEKLSGLKNEALLLDEGFKEIKRTSIRDLDKAEIDAYAFVIDDIITKNVVEMAGKCKYIVGITTASNLNVPEDKIIVTKF
jgi:5S rRNA maturation endonuclease (ribonuclease M5)